MSKNQAQQEKILKILAWFLVGLTFLFSLSAATTNALYLFLLFFVLFCWQKHRLQNLFLRLTKRLSPFLTYLLVATLWAVILEFTLGRFAFHTQPIMSFLIFIGFYLPYFAIWYKLISRFKFNFLEVFYLAGVSGILFGLVITKQILAPFAIHANLKIAFLAFGARMMATLSIYGVLISLPYLLLLKKETSSEKPLKHYLLATTTTFLILPVFLIWSKLINLLRSVLG